MPNPTTTAGSAALAPIRRWVLYRPWRLITVCAAIPIILFGVGRCTSSPPTTTPDAAAAAEATATTVRHLTAGQEVSATDAAAVTDIDQARKSPQIVAMQFASGYVDTATTTGQWITTLTPLASPGAVNGEFVAARPTFPVTITGPTSTAEGGRLVVVPTSTGQFTVHLDASDGGWLVTTPLPSLDGASPPTTTTDDTDTEEEAPAPSTTAPSVTPTPPAPTRTTTPAPVPAPAPKRPRPGPIPTPSLDGPLPA